MAQATDVVIDGAGYMLATTKQAYRRGQDGIAEGRAGRVQIRDFYGGQLRPFQLERDRAFRGESVGPAYGGQGVRPWAAESVGTLPGTITATLTGRSYATVVGDYVYFTNGGDKILRITNAIGASSIGGVQQCRSHSVPITGLTHYGDQLLYGLGSSGDMLVTTDYPACTTASTLATGERGWGVAGWSGSAIWASAKASDKSNTIAMVHGQGIEKRFLDTKIMTLGIADGAVWAVTRTGLHRYTGRIADVMIPNPGWTAVNGQPTSIPGKEWSGDWQFVFQHGLYAAESDHRFLVGYGGRLYTNVGGFIGEYRPDGGRAGWRDTGLHYVSCTGAAVCGGYLVVTITTERETSEIWAWDGAGWWMVRQSATFTWCHPVACAGIGGWDVLVMIQGSATYTLFRLEPRSPTQTAIPAGTAHWYSPLIDAGERDKDKAWRKIGCVFADPLPMPTGSTDAITVAIDYSVDAGDTWVAGSSMTLTGDAFAHHNLTLDATIASAAAVSRFIMLRVTWSGLVDWAPTLVDAWTEFELLDSPARRRKWLLALTAADQTIDRDGAVLTMTGRQLIATLWDDWQGGTTLPYRDIDYDAAPVTRNVRITGIEEDAERPSDAGRWGQSVIRLTLVEV